MVRNALGVFSCLSSIEQDLGIDRLNDQDQLISHGGCSTQQCEDCQKLGLHYLSQRTAAVRLYVFSGRAYLAISQPHGQSLLAPSSSDALSGNYRPGYWSWPSTYGPTFLAVLASVGSEAIIRFSTSLSNTSSNRYRSQSWLAST